MDQPDEIKFVEFATIAEIDSEGNAYLPLSDKILAILGVKEGDEIDVEVRNGELILKRKI